MAARIGSQLPAYPAIKSINYFDAPVAATGTAWQLTSQGISEFATLGKEPLLSPLG